ncbi:GATA transcription factor 25-like isoform X2 [Punica granatum]|uniref:GATA transcription factor 25-like isoform X2 n=1 Tax=Punica granatum TaxID=22663 RepID=A0A6P8DRM0_PUNGR|nr:GATA transcription factor 25-like isoform X2 [Punica granatum]
MYAAHPHHHHHHHLEIPDQIAGEEDAASVSPAGDSLDDSRIHYEHHPALLTGGSAIDEVPPEAAYVSGDGTDLAVPGHEDDSSQLTLSFQGQVYVFDAVTPKKVHAVLLLLGGYELSSGSQGVDMSLQTHRGVVDLPSRCSQPQRVASLNRFRQKRKERCFDRKVRYSVRQEVALRMQRSKGQFTSIKKSEGDTSWGSGQESGQDDVPQESSCTHCGISSKCTPMMRRGPSGLRSLCNACGLFWANRGTLRDLTKRPPDHALTSVEQGGERNGLEGM